MKIQDTNIEGVRILSEDRQADSRGWFVRTFCKAEFEEAGLHSDFPQCSASFNRTRGTLRGLHFQDKPRMETKIVRCVRGAAFDIVLDLRPESASFLTWISIELSAENRDAVYIPEGCAHGFQTLTDGAELAYQISVPFDASLSRGIRWNDPDLSIPWPVKRPTLSERDRTLPWLSEYLGGGCAAA